MRHAQSPYTDSEGVRVPLRYGRHYKSGGKTRGFGLKHLEGNGRWDPDWQFRIRDVIQTGDKFEVDVDRTEYWKCFYDIYGNPIQYMVVVNPELSAYDGQAFGVITAIRYFAA